MFDPKPIVVFLVLVVLHIPGVVAAEHRVSVLSSEDSSRYQAIHESFSRLLDGGDITLFLLIPDGSDASLQGEARKAHALGAEVIVTYGAAATRAVLTEGSATPVVYADVTDPAVQDFIPDPWTPGEGVTGIRGDAPVQTLLKHARITTEADHLAVLYAPNDRPAQKRIAALRRIAVSHGWQVFFLAVDDGISADQFLARLPDQAEVLYCDASLGGIERASRWISYALERHLPVISQTPGLAELGALMVLETDPAEQGEKLAAYVNRLLAGSPLQELPPQNPRQVSLVVNLETAERLGIRVPFEILAATDRLVR